MTKSVESIGAYLFAQDTHNVYAILDGASIKDLLDRLYSDLPDFICLFPGDLEPDMAYVAPYLVHLKPETPFTDWVLEQGWGKHWGIFALSRNNIRVMRQHFSTFIIVYDTLGTPLRFRYYDPRVLRAYLPTCNANDVNVLFGPVSEYVVEDEDPKAAIVFRGANGAVQQGRLGIANG